MPVIEEAKIPLVIATSVGQEPVLLLVAIDKGERDNIGQSGRNELRQLLQTYEKNIARESPRRSHKSQAGRDRAASGNGELKMSKLGKKRIAAAKEGVAIARGEADPASYRVHVLAEIDVRAMRRRLGMSQEAFALRYGFTPARVRDWEQGRWAPDGAVRAYLKVIEKEPKAVERALAMA
jgi:putative transcriptional regulator